jgi:hypothetical protein
MDAELGYHDSVDWETHLPLRRAETEKGVM